MNWNVTDFLQYVVIIIHVLTIMSGKQSHATEIKSKKYVGNNNKHTHTPIKRPLFPGLPRWAGTREVKPIRILLKQEAVSGSGMRCLHLAPDR